MGSSESKTVKSKTPKELWPEFLQNTIIYSSSNGVRFVEIYPRVGNVHYLTPINRIFDEHGYPKNDVNIQCHKNDDGTFYLLERLIQKYLIKIKILLQCQSILVSIQRLDLTCMPSCGIQTIF